MARKDGFAEFVKRFSQMPVAFPVFISGFFVTVLGSTVHSQTSVFVGLAISISAMAHALKAPSETGDHPDGDVD